ncbi:MAG: HAD-IA family hydrolase [Sedimentisphaerales bacterium]|nr:HAD-IA family hydrolase [Sedimentisphaerales bacterium]
MRNGKQAVVFDLDGTLVDTLRDIAGSVNVALRRYQQPGHPVESYRRRVGDGNRVLIQRSLAADKQHLLEAVLQMQLDYYAGHFCVFSRPYPGIEPLLAALKERGLKLAVLSNKPDRFLRPLMGALFGEGLFDILQGQIPDVPLKPDPTSVLAVLARLGVSPDRAVYVGDSGVDMQTARRAGLFAVGAGWGFRDRDELEQNGAQAWIERPGQLLELVPGQTCR